MDLRNDSFFEVVDYVVFGAMLFISVIIGVYFAFFAKHKQNTADEYLMGGKTMGVVPIAVSLIAGHISGISMLGLPSEMYSYGTQLWIGVIAEVLSFGLAAFCFVPVLYNLELTSSYEYLQLRYNNTLRKLGSALYLLGTLLYIPIVMYAPALGLNQMTGISLHILIPITCCICIFYTSLGGVRAVVWTDTAQAGLILLSVILVAAIGTIQVGGVSEVWARNANTSRIEFFNWSADPTVRHTFWNVMIGRFFTNLSICAVNQGMVQRYLAMPSLTKAKVTILLLSIGWMVLISLCCYTGIVIFAAFYDCDPVMLGHVAKSDQILPYFVITQTKSIPALAGIFMAGVYSAALSSMSACLNSMSGVLYQDFIRPYMLKSEDHCEKKASLIMKTIAVIIGVVTVLLSFLVDKLGGIIQTTYSLSSISHGTIFAIYMLGMFFPWVTSTGVLCGGIVSTLFVGWISFGTQLAIGNHQISFPKKPFTTDGCPKDVLSSLNSTIMATPLPEVEEAFPLYRVSYIYYTVISIIVCSVVAFLVSWLTGPNDPSKMDKKLFCPQLQRFFQFSEEEKKVPTNGTTNLETIMLKAHITTKNSKETS